jgi:hypothetical protein
MKIKNQESQDPTTLKSIKYQVGKWAYIQPGREGRDRKQGEERLR